MKTIKTLSLTILSLMIVSLVVFTACNDDEDKRETIDQNMLTSVELKVEGMTCTGCEQTVTNAVMELSGINHTKVSHKEGNALVEFDKSKTSEEEIVRAITESGYTVVE
jgi:copper chaperone CopZ